jgi:Short C-terminal domain
MASIQELLPKLHRSAQEGLKQALQPGESIKVLILGERNQAIIGTDRRAFVFKKGITSGAFFSKQLNSWDYRNISGIELKQGMTSQAVVVEVPGVAPVTKTKQMDKGVNSVWEAPNAIMVGGKVDLAPTIGLLRKLIADFHQPHSIASPMPSQPDAIEQVRRLAELRDDGILSEEEFQMKKRQLLGL